MENKPLLRVVMELSNQRNKFDKDLQNVIIVSKLLEETFKNAYLDLFTDEEYGEVEKKIWYLIQSLNEEIEKLEFSSEEMGKAASDSFEVVLDANRQKILEGHQGGNQDDQ